MLRALLLVAVGLFLVADGVLAFARPAAMWSYASHSNDWLRALIALAYVGFGLHLIVEWT